MTSPSFTTTAPTGTSPSAAACVARSRAAYMNVASSGRCSFRPVASPPAGPLLRGLNESLPLDGRRRLRRHIVDDAVHAPHLVDDAARGAREQRVGKLRPVGGHEVGG